MKEAVSKFNIGIEEKNLEEFLKREKRLLDPAAVVLVVGADERIAEVPRLLCEERIRNVVATRAKILDCEKTDRSGVAFAKRMNLPDTGDERGKVRHESLFRKSLIAKALLPIKLVLERREKSGI